ncbi:hypothetical protein Tco_0730170 [Tanacetum coccineum]|uniref:Uncharacterized protein n=1 Tax=Tanacetum coccineum TaxID=301880 RepID=A0ABQ4YR29_9ASTR
MLENQDIPNQVSKAVDEIVTDAVDWAMLVPLRERFRDLLEADMKEILHNRMWESKSYQTHEDHMTLYEALEKSIARDNRDQLLSDLAETAASEEYTAWTMTDTKIKPSVSPIPEELHMGYDTTADEQAYLSSGEDVGREHIPTASALKSTYTPPPENSLLAQIDDMATFMDCASPVPNGRMPQTSHRSSGRCNPKVQRQQTTTVGWPSLSISKMKVAYYPDVGLEQMVPNQMWIEEECKYDVAAMYGISHWWFQRQQFYIDRHTSEGDRRAVQTHMHILSVIRIEVFLMYRYNYMKKIILHRADLKEYVISERDFKYLYPSNFEDLYLLNLQGHLNHLLPKDKKILTTAVNL